MMDGGAFQFTPTALPPDVLDRRTVAREEVLERILDRIARAVEHQGVAHTLVVGSRGSGKTHLLTVATHRARSQIGAARLVVVSLTEDAEGIASYADLLYTVIERALVGGAVDRGNNPELLNAARLARRDPNALEALLSALIDERVLVLVVENLNRVFDDLGTEGRQRLRAFVEQRRTVMLLTSTPLLFDAVSDRDEAWFGSFTAEHLSDIDTERGAELLARLARERGDDRLAAVLKSDDAVARLRAVNHIAGGSARIWVMLSGCVSVERLDALVPLVERLMEELVPYYKARFDELAGNERKLVVELARTSIVDAAGDVRFVAQGARTAKDLANASGIEPDVARTSLRRLYAARWVREQDVPGGDRRSTWYELREPLFRHYLQHRETGDGALALIVRLLQAWYAEPQRVRMLASLPDDGRAVPPLLASLEAPPSSDAGYAGGDPDELLGEAHRWDGGNTALGPLSRDVVRAVVAAARDEEIKATSDAAIVAGARATMTGPVDERQRIAAGLVAAADAADGDGAAELTLLAAGWLGAIGQTREALGLLENAPAATGDRLRLALDAERAYFSFYAGDRRPATAAALRTRDERAEVFGETDPDTLTSRSNVAGFSGELGERAAARDAYQALLTDRQRILGPDHPSTLTTRHNLAYQLGQLGELGELAAARDAYQALLSDRQRILGPDHPDTLSTRHNLAYQLGELGEHAAARDAYQALLSDRQRILGPDHPNTLTTRHNLAWVRAITGHAQAAIEDVLDIGAHPQVNLDVGALLALAIRWISDPDEARTIVGRLRSSAAVGDPAPIVIAAARAGVINADRDRWLTAWAAALEGSPAERVLDAAARLLGGDAAPAAVLPDEERRLAEQLAVGHP